MPIIRVEMFKGRSRDQKRAVARALTEDFTAVVGGKLESATLLSEDDEKENWAMGGALMAHKYPD